MTALFFQGAPYDDWSNYNWRHRRFYVLNVSLVLAMLRVSHTNSGEYFRQARETIVQETAWPSQFRGDYVCSKVQVYPTQATEPKLLDKAAAIVIALELMSRAKNSEVNIYDYVRIVPAFYTINGFSRATVEALGRFYKANPELPPGRSATEFSAGALMAAGQPQSRLLEEIAAGYCVTRSVAQGIKAFIDPWAPPELTVGPVLPAGDVHTFVPELGSKNAAPSLAPPRFAPDALPEIQDFEPTR